MLKRKGNGYSKKLKTKNVLNCLNPFPPGFCHVIYYQCGKKYPCPGAIGLCKQAVMISISFTYTFQFFHCRRSKKKCLSRKSSLHCTTRALQNTYIKKFVVLIFFLNSDKNVW